MGFFIKIGNAFNKAILKSPLHSLASRNTVLLTFTGRKSGKTFTTPVNYAQDGNILRITSNTQRTWWRNVKANPEVELRLRGKSVSGTAEVFDSPDSVCEELTRYLSTFPQAARFMGISKLEDGSYNPDELMKASKGRVMVRIRVRG